MRPEVGAQQVVHAWIAEPAGVASRDDAIGIQPQ